MGDHFVTDDECLSEGDEVDDEAYDRSEESPPSGPDEQRQSHTKPEDDYAQSSQYVYGSGFHARYTLLFRLQCREKILKRRWKVRGSRGSPPATILINIITNITIKVNDASNIYLPVYYRDKILLFYLKRYMLHKIHLQSTICRVYSSKQLHQGGVECG